MAYGRITQSMLDRALLTDLNGVQNRMSTIQRKLSSGKEINRPSDDPFGTSRAMSLRGELEGINQYKRNVDDSLAWLQTSDTAFASVSDVIQRARELALQGSSDVMDSTSRESLAGEIDQLVEAAKSHMNATYAGRYVFSGTATDTPPYSQGATDTYAGDGNSIAREIGPGVSVQLNAIGSDVLGDGQAAGDNKLLDVLRDIADHLRTNTAANRDALRGTDLQRLDANFDELSRLRATTGALTNRLESAQGSLTQLQETTTGLLSNIEDADMAKTIVDYTTQQSVYQSALKAGANVMQTSLLDFLR
jgi:flagellar hook-associated protein 3 FlgL